MFVGFSELGVAFFSPAPPEGKAAGPPLVFSVQRAAG